MQMRNLVMVCYYSICGARLFVDCLDGEEMNPARQVDKERLNGNSIFYR